MMRSLALVVERTGYEIEPEHVRLMVDAVDSKKLLSRDGRLAGWNFEGANNPDQPSVWVTAVTVLALERLVRMLDERINCIVLANFEVITPNKPQSSLRLGDLIYPDYGFAQHYHVEEGAKPIALRLGNMRAQLMRVPLNTSGEKKGQETRPIFSAVFYGPPATGKTTLAEALAFSSGVPLVRLSPFDLVVDPRGSDEPGTIQGRAQIVFEALSMLTRTVILFDEFETALANRSEEGKPAIASVVAGLLPKLVKLHDVALTQGLVYFLATNYRKRLDDAAIRRGRFDIHLPVFHPDPLSRTATLFYRLERVRAAARRKGCEDAKAWTGDAWQLDSSAAVRLLEIIAREANTSATALAQDVFRLPPWILNSEQEWPNEWKKDLPVFTYILENAPDLEEKKATPSFKVKASSDNENDLHEVEKEEKRWLDRFERAFQNSVVAAKKRIKDTSVPMTGALILQQCLDDSLTAASNRSS
jgi:hypothetical protein